MWKFLLYSEIARTVGAQLRERSLYPQDKYEQRLFDLLDRDNGMLAEDFAVRLERCISQLLATTSTINFSVVERNRIAISEALHNELLNELRQVLGDVLVRKTRVALLIDNLDKAWDSNTDINGVAQFLLGLLSVAGRITLELRSANAFNKSINFSLALFLRSDIFYKVREVAREADKIDFERINWSDNELLLRVIEERLTVSSRDGLLPEQVWKQYFCSDVSGIPVKDYLLQRVLPRPRDLVYLVKEAIGTAVNRKHTHGLIS